VSKKRDENLKDDSKEQTDEIALMKQTGMQRVMQSVRAAALILYVSLRAVVRVLVGAFRLSMSDALLWSLAPSAIFIAMWLLGVFFITLPLILQIATGVLFTFTVAMVSVAGFRESVKSKPKKRMLKPAKKASGPNTPTPDPDTRPPKDPED